MEQKRTSMAASKYGPRGKNQTAEITATFRLPTKDFSADERGQRA